ncbi:MAG TPA: PEPxxWA-CTERM sorting domain-containing protein [Caulobacteraceae bacterium]|nr:PEPxxWA-CTERM sorting domain-containing protein [Caulobacteraceae bacterium]
MQAAAFAAAMGVAGAASATTVSVSGFAGPWDPTVAGNPTYGFGDQSAPTSVAVTPGENVTITYLSGLTGAFGGGPATVDALGYTGLTFGSGVGLTGIGSSGQPFPSFWIDPTNSGPDIFLNALIGDFVNGAGVIVGGPFATGDGPFVITAPAGATALQLGVNDDIFFDNSGSLSISVTGGVPEPATWAMMLLGVGLVGAGMRMARPKTSAALGAQ